MSFGSDFVLTLFTDDPRLSRIANEAGIDRIGPDLEILGKKERQDASRDRISCHDLKRLPAVAKTLRLSCLFARIDPVSERTSEEVEFLLRQGVQALMLPYFQHPDQVRRFVDLVGGRARTILLLETPQAMVRVREVVAVPGVDEIHVGLNDLHRGLGLASHFELLCSPVMEMLSDLVNGAGLWFGFGGVGRVDDRSLPVGSELVYPQYLRLHGRSAIVSRVFLRPGNGGDGMSEDVQRARRYLDRLAGWSPAELERSRKALLQRLGEL